MTIYYRVSDMTTIRKIQERFGFPKRMTVNGEWPVMVKDEDWQLLLETEKRKYIDIRYKQYRYMKATKPFIESVSKFLTEEAERDKEFAKKMAEHPEKTVEGACNYIMAEVWKTKQSGWANEEIYGLAKHFFDEDEIKDPGSSANNISRVVVNTHIDLTESEKQEAMEEAKKDFTRKLEVERMRELDAQKEKEKKAKEKRIKEAQAKKEKEATMMGDLFGGNY